jgi:hypothetical protein
MTAAVAVAAFAVAASSLPPLSLLLMPMLVVALSARPAAYQLNHQA